MKGRVFRSVAAVMEAYFPQEAEKERRAALTDEERIKEDVEEITNRIIKKFRVRLRRMR